ncbi:hypothetical protein SEENIN0B_01124 [Salmonella enterica subsp. enterica serovar Infantis str. SARB27]|uniref:Uncharacterized protein n=2 Tax=Salmonella infantis TaxID=595 RepID=A0A5Y7ANX2_SALIN|nr:hypothetical protein [Salmonella enterica]ECA5091611.1 hypothetical protein [Salmonella enterica subsp. enterica serovar Menston]ECK9504165.1 hypothetical protein [Salmonella enterica subsp. enterica serovar Infantis str. CFSAN000522]EHB41273.1 hypothetical protein SEENIN0B_01124 [Salmonella enterica subsp. enterica serovar Infantis str. SARB27]QCV24265.1 hypothetical protein FE265_05390 [Salmonella enterica subsp. enterica serovar Infantis]QCV28744.1 hypothetical protein FE168_05380 [Salmo
MNIDLSIKKGKIIFNEFSLKEDASLDEQLDNLKEDMLQVKFPGEFILDVGWHPSFDINGQFYIYLIKNFDWEMPTYSGNARDIESLEFEINQAISKI